MKFGLKKTEIELIKSVFAKYPEISCVKVFGSRAKGTHRKNSDIDLTYFGELDLPSQLKVSTQLDELPLPYQFDVQAYNNIKHDKLKDHIDRVGQVFYERR